jgi:hypothetical protein
MEDSYFGKVDGELSPRQPDDTSAARRRQATTRRWAQGAQLPTAERNDAARLLALTLIHGYGGFEIDLI